MDLIIFATSQGLLFLLIVLGYRKLSRHLDKKFEKQNVRLAGNKNREEKIIRGLEHLGKRLKEKIVW